MSISKEEDNSIFPKISTNPLSKGDNEIETNNQDAENSNTTNIASADSSFEEGDEDYDDEQEEIDKKKKAEESSDKSRNENYMDYGSNSDANKPAE